MEILPSFGLSLWRNDYMMSWNIKSGYRHFSLYPLMRDLFGFRYAGLYRCIALPFGWRRYVLWFVELMRPFVRYIRAKWRYCILPYIDDFLSGFLRSAQRHKRDFWRAGRRIEALLVWVGLTRYPEKGCWKGSQQIEHLGVLMDIVRMRVFVTDGKVRKMRRLAREFLECAGRNRRLVSHAELRHFCGVAVSLTLALPLARFYTRSLYWDMLISRCGGGGHDTDRPRARHERGGFRAGPYANWGLGASLGESLA
jgi:hypothetical protein